MPHVLATLIRMSDLKTIDAVKKKLMTNVDRQKQNQNSVALKYKIGLEGIPTSLKL